MTPEMRARLLAFAAAFARHATRNPPFVHLEAHFESCTVAFMREYPDRLFCGTAAFAALRERGFQVAPALPTRGA